MKDNLVILIPLPPEAEWNNQGIGRTVETISCELLENNDNLSITFLVAAHCGEQIRNSLRLSKYAGLYTVYELKSLYSIIGKLFHFKRDRKRSMVKRLIQKINNRIQIAKSKVFYKRPLTYIILVFAKWNKGN